ncbi:hypothetical protein D9753_06150 [Streptomyces dangxiongensis]|uniref:Uncharacterized protein n=1 Tax=Streptomyces dangxiongensis TaxID=1442032 RepID=A0A3G2JDI1_9ACTN|nr:hypothetical protein [Streptomyces dangxiongensis]AYN38572.1 hypothetical protein D9753_06150 [Streptomyces dangxiongensis]
MTLSPHLGLFARVERDLGSREPLTGLRSDEGSDAPAAGLTLAEARPVLYDRSQPPTVRTALWYQVVALSREDTAGNGWRLGAVWLALPGLRRHASTIVRRFGTDRDDVEAEMLTAYLETLRTVEPSTPDPGSVLLRAACSSAWNAAKQARPEKTVEDIQSTVDSRDGRGALWQAEFDGPDRPDGLGATLRITVPAERAEGVRIGALATEWGLAASVSEACGVRRGRRIGTLALRPGSRG